MRPELIRQPFLRANTQPKRVNRQVCSANPLKKGDIVWPAPIAPNRPNRRRQKLQNAPPDEFGVTHHDILFSEKDDQIYCVLEAPDAEAVEKHHAAAGIHCDFVHEVQSTRG